MLKASNIMASRKEELIKYQMEETGAGRLFVERTFVMGVTRPLFLLTAADAISTGPGALLPKTSSAVSARTLQNFSTTERCTTMRSADMQIWPD